MKLGTKLGRCKSIGLFWFAYISEVDDVICASRDRFVLKKFNFFASSGIKAIIQETLSFVYKGGRIFCYVSLLHGPIKQGRSVEIK